MQKNELQIKFQQILRSWSFLPQILQMRMEEALTPDGAVVLKNKPEIFIFSHPTQMSGHSKQHIVRL